MNTFWILMEQIELFIVYLVIGVILVRTGVLSDKGLDWIARVVMKLSLPTMIFVNVVSQVDRVALVKSLSIIGLAVTASTLLYGLGVVLTKLFHVEGDRAQIYRAMTMFGNVGFMGIPIITSIFQERGMLYVSVFTIVDQLAMWTVGVKLTSPSGKGKFDPKKLINPATVAIALAIFFVLTGLKLPGVLQTGFQNIGATATPLAMIYRMCFHIYVSHFRNAKIQIDLCGGNIRMSKHFLHTLHVRSILQHMCGKRMSQCMRRDIMLDPGFLAQTWAWPPAPRAWRCRSR